MYNITVMGNSPVDVLAHVEEDFLISHNLNKADFNPVSEEVFKDIAQSVHFEGMESGGSTANTAWTLGTLGKKVYFIGRIGDDPAGRHFYKEMTQANIDMPQPADNAHTMEIFVLITPDGERTFVSRGVVSPMTADMINETAIEKSDWLLLEGYTLLDQEAAVNKAITYALKHNTKIAFAVSAAFAIHAKFNTIAKEILPYIHLLIANDEEFHTLTDSIDKLEHEKDKKDFFQNLMKVEKIITHSEKGATYIYKDGEITVETTPVPQPLDVTGAGDAFTAGFLYHYLEGAAEEGIHLGHALAGKVINQLGGRLKDIPFIKTAQKAS